MSSDATSFSASTFSAHAWGRNLPTYEAIRSMPFNDALADGTLSLERFRHYMVQDAHYLIAFGRGLAIAAAKADDPDGLVQFAEAAKVAVVVERSLHADFFDKFGIGPEEFGRTEMSPVCHHYSNFLIANAYAEPYPVVLAALLPCFWIYAEIGRDILGRAVRPNPYDAWIDTYAGEEFHEAVRAVIATTDRAAAGASPDVLTRMHAAYKRATQLEWMFWDSAWRMADWPV
ncbi:transcriptional activator, TenA family [Ancylobacter novellus DSM 506]|uniref:Aminopyrimidine aminohydrolase n=1 Tax=Ancylobacter novellus (strain ATCC 8093 / DSM 506 / JCM 20403 / CCM 1077 / IAM 12100 / NBRC 12443 / NCIMB 10456) TaxID=639283 RepID=D7A9J3_ANCN5|nr:TenA family protein [Ancylobacter novellus]ADH90755.1 transcriptional activator, TenA family [Ancylobacter novellus DSM 506]